MSRIILLLFLLYSITLANHLFFEYKRDMRKIKESDEFEKDKMDNKSKMASKKNINNEDNISKKIDNQKKVISNKDKDYKKNISKTSASEKNSFNETNKSVSNKKIKKIKRQKIDKHICNKRAIPRTFVDTIKKLISMKKDIFETTMEFKDKKINLIGQIENCYEECIIDHKRCYSAGKFRLANYNADESIAILAIEWDAKVPWDKIKVDRFRKTEITIDPASAKKIFKNYKREEYYFHIRLDLDENGDILAKEYIFGDYDLKKGALIDREERGSIALEEKTSTKEPNNIDKEAEKERFIKKTVPKKCEASMVTNGECSIKDMKRWYRYQKNM